MKINKIYILGTSGSGKTYLAEQLSNILKIKSYNLDDIFWIKKFTKRLTKEKRKPKLKKLLDKKEKWIIEGVYTDWSIDALRKSDLVIWLDPPFRIRSWRIFKRYISRKIKKQYTESLKDCYGLIKYSYRYKKEHDSTSYFSHNLILNKHKINFIKLNNNKEINKFLNTLK